jgi:hypothetical protein
MISEVSQAQKDKGHMFSFICGDRQNTHISNIMTKRLCKGDVTNGRGRVKEGS